jgi:hypothetical protein
MEKRMNSALRHLAVLALAVLLVPTLSGCAVFSQLAGAFPAVKPAKYKNLAGQSVTVIVSADPGTRIDNPRIQFDVAQMILSKLEKSQKEDKPDELKLTRFPVSAGSVARFQEDHPDLADSMEEIAPRLGTSRVIYVEIRGFQTRSEVSNDLYRGVISGSVSVIEVNSGKGHTVPVDETLHITYPRTSPDEGLPNIGDFPIYSGTLEGFTTEIAKLFLPHADDPDADYGPVSTPNDLN